MNSSRILSSLGKKYGVPSLFGFAGWLTFSDNAKQMNFANVQSLSFFQPNTADAEPLEKRLTLRKKLTDMSLQEKWDYFTLVSINPGEDDDDVSGTKKETGIFVLIYPDVFLYYFHRTKTMISMTMKKNRIEFTHSSRILLWKNHQTLLLLQILFHLFF